MTTEAAQNREAIAQIQTRLALGQITYDQAKEQAAPVIARINDRAKEIAKKYGKSHHEITFKELMR